MSNRRQNWWTVRVNCETPPLEPSWLCCQVRERLHWLVSPKRQLHNILWHRIPQLHVQPLTYNFHIAPRFQIPPLVTFTLDLHLPLQPSHVPPVTTGPPHIPKPFKCFVSSSALDGEAKHVRKHLIAWNSLDFNRVVTKLLL